MQHNGAQFFVFPVSSQAHVQQNKVLLSQAHISTRWTIKKNVL